MILLDITIPGDPVPKGRPRSGGGRTYTPDRTRDAETRVRGFVDTSVWRRPKPYEGPVTLTVKFFCATRRRTDGDNLLKLITDAIQRGKHGAGGIIMDDAQIEEWYCRIWRRGRGQEPRTEILLRTLDEPREGTAHSGTPSPRSLSSSKSVAVSSRWPTTSKPTVIAIRRNSRQRSSNSSWMGIGSSASASMSSFRCSTR